MSKQVSIEANDSTGVQTILEKGFLSSEFIKTVTKIESAKIELDSNRFTFTASRDDFKTLADQGAFSPAVVAAFKDADDRLTKFDSERSGFLARLWDSFRYNDTMTTGHPVVQCPTTIKDMNRVQVTVKRYGLAK